MECNEKYRVSTVKNTERDYLKEFQESDQKSDDYPIKKTQNNSTSFVNSESKEEFKLGVNGNFFSNSDRSQKDLKMKESNGPPISNNSKNTLSNLNKKFFSLKIKEKFEASTSTENLESKDVGKVKNNISDCAEISAKLSVLSLTNRKEDGCSKKPEIVLSKSKGLSEQGSKVFPNDASERDSKMKENISNAKSEESLDNLESKVDKDAIDLENVEKDKSHHSFEDIILGLEKTHLTERGGPDKIEKSYVRRRPKPTRILHEADIAFLNRTSFRRNDPPFVLNQEDSFWLSNSFDHSQSFSPSLQTNYQGNYPSFTQNDIPPLVSLDNPSEPVNIDEITPTLRNISPDPSLGSHLFTESLELFSEIPQDAGHSISISNEIQSSFTQKQNFSHRSSTIAESRCTDSSLKSFQGENFADVSEDRLKRYSNMCPFSYYSSEDLLDNENKAEILRVSSNYPRGSEDNSPEPVNIDEITPTLSLRNISSDPSFSSHLSTESLELFSEIPQESQYTESSLNLFQGDNSTYVSEYIPKRHSSTSSFHDQSSEESNYLPDYENEAVVPCGSFESNHESLGLPVLSGNDTEKFFNSLSKSSVRNDSEQYRTAQFQHEILENQPQVRQSDEFGNARTLSGYTSNEITSPTIFQQSSSPHQNENSNSSISSTFSDLNPFMQTCLSSKITSLTKRTLKAYISPTQNASDAQPSKHTSFSQIRYKPPVKEPFRCLDYKQTVSNSLRDNFFGASNLQPVGNQSEWISNPPNSERSSSRGGNLPITFAVKSFYQNKLMNTPIFKEKYQEECARFEKEIQQLKLGTDLNKIIYEKNKTSKETNLHIALKDRNIVRFYIIVEKYKEYHQNTSDINARDYDGKTVYDIAKKFMEDGIEYMDLVVKYLKENSAVEGMERRRRRKKGTKQDLKPSQ